MAEIPLTRGFVSLVDEEDLPLVTKYRWQAVRIHKVLYAQTDSRGKTRYMHRLIMGEPAVLDVDHINGNGLDNRRQNLRVVTRGVNMANAQNFTHSASGYRGVIASRTRRSWLAQIKYQQRILQSHVIYDIIEAALLRDELARQLFGEQVYLNLPDVKPSEWIVREAQRIIRRRQEG